MSEAKNDESGVQPVVNVPMPDEMTRPETGPIQFGDDWHGVFIRGDNAMHYAKWLRAAIEEDMQDIWGKTMLHGLLDVLESCKAPGRS